MNPGPDIARLNPATLPPPLDERLVQIAERLVARGQIGLIYITIQHRRTATARGWHAYESVQRELMRFLRDYGQRHLRRDDAVFETASSGNALLVILDEPREARAIELRDVVRVRARLQGLIGQHMEKAIDRDASGAFSCCVGGALMRHDSGVPVERIVYHALEEAFADALSMRERATRSEAVQLRCVLETRSVRSVYQPLVDIVERRTIGYEALTRVPPQRFRSPEQLFKAANELDVAWRLERLCRARALEGLPPLEDGQQLFLNTLPCAIGDPQLHDGTFAAELAGRGLRPDQVVLEITEHSEVDDFATFRRQLDALRRDGYQLAMDDVGSGYSSLQSIAEIAPDYIKADMTLVRDVHLSPLKQELIATVTRFSERTGIVLIAEGVESPDELSMLASLGVRCVQGFLLARPDAPPDHPAWDVVI